MQSMELASRRFLMSIAVVHLSVAVSAEVGLTAKEFIDRHDVDGDGAMDEVELRERVRPPEFKWVNPLPDDHGLDGVQHSTFLSPSMRIPVRLGTISNG
jgi:hypothetical protein